MDPTHVRTSSQYVDEGTLPPPDRVVPATQVPVEPIVVERSPAAAQVATVRTSRQISAPAVVTGIVGVVLLIVGLIVCLRAGFSSPMNAPVVHVLGFAHTATLGIIEVGAGIVLLLAAVSGSRSSQIFMGTVLGVFGVVAAAEPTKLQEQLAIEKSLGVLLAIAGLVIVLAAALLPTYSSYVERSARARV